MIMEHVVIRVAGMSCQGCVSSVTHVLKAVEGVDQVAVSLEAGEAAVDYDPRKTNPPALREAIEEAGYQAN
jgi:copper chaperone